MDKTESSQWLYDPLFEPNTDVKGWIIREHIGKGGFGRVYRAENAEVEGLECAIKFMGAKTFPAYQELKQRWGDEVRAMHRLIAVGHPNIVRILDAGKFKGFPFIRMEYVAGDTLDFAIRAERLPLPRDLNALKITKGILGGLAAVHSQGIVHRDIKPGNILLDKQNSPKITDFGIVDLQGGGNITLSDEVVGSIVTIAPEQIPSESGRKIEGPINDIWGVGLTLYSMLTGWTPSRDRNIRGLNGRPPLTGFDELLYMTQEFEPTDLRPVYGAEHGASLNLLLSQLLERDYKVRLSAPEAYHRVGELVNEFDVNSKTVPLRLSRKIDCALEDLIRCARSDSDFGALKFVQTNGSVVLVRVDEYEELTGASNPIYSAEDLDHKLPVFLNTANKTMPYVIGRHRGVDVPISNSRVSRKHAVITKRTVGVYTICDEQSTNGTWVNGKRISGTFPLKTGDLIGFGGSEVAYVFARTCDLRKYIRDGAPTHNYGTIGFSTQSIPYKPQTTKRNAFGESEAAG